MRTINRKPLQLFFVFYFFTGVLFAQSFEQVGNDIIGFNGSIGYFDKANGVSISDDGKTVALGCFDCINPTDPNEVGNTSVYKWNGTSWVQLGASIWGEFSSSFYENYSGYSIDLSSDGTVLAIGAPRHYAGNYPNDGYYGKVTIYEWNGSNWVMRGNPIIGTDEEEQLGVSIELNYDGNILVAGAYNNSVTGVQTGAARVYAWTGNSWIQLGTDLYGANYDVFGIAVSISSDGNRIAVGAGQYDPVGDLTEHYGVTRVYQWSGSNWNQLGQNILGENVSDRASMVSLSGDGNSLIIGAYYNNNGGSVAGSSRIFIWNGTSWEQKGNSIDGDNSNDLSGYNVSISADGNTIATSATKNSDNGTNTGKVRVYKWNGFVWFQQGDDIDGVNAEEHLGNAIKLNNDGTKLVVGANSSSSVGVVRVYSFCTAQKPTVSVISGNELSCNTVSAESYQWLDCNNNYSIINFATNNNFIATSNGNYAVVVTDFGCKDTSDCVAISITGLEEIERYSIRFYPNPTEDILTVHSSELIIEKLTLIEVNGQVVTRQVVNDNTFILDISNVETGVYYLYITTSEGDYTHKVVKN